MTGPEFKQLRDDLGCAIGRPLSAADMAKLCGLSAGDGATTIRRWEVSGPGGTAAELLRILAMASAATRSWRISTSSTASISTRRKGPRAGKPSAKRCGTRFAGASADPAEFLPHRVICFTSAARGLRYQRRTGLNRWGRALEVANGCCCRKNSVARVFWNPG